MAECALDARWRQTSPAGVAKNVSDLARLERVGAGRCVERAAKPGLARVPLHRWLEGPFLN